LWPEVVEHHGNDPVATAPGSDFVYPHSGHIAAIRVLTQSLCPAGKQASASGLCPWWVRALREWCLIDEQEFAPNRKSEVAEMAERLW